MKHTRLDRDPSSTKWIKSTLLLGGVLLAVLLLAGLASAESRDQDQRIRLSEDGKPIAKDPVASETVVKKTPQRLVTFGGKSYGLSKDTIIVGQNGRQVRLKNLLIPCDVRIVYRWVKGKRKALRVKVLRFASDAKNEMSYDIPE